MGSAPGSARGTCLNFAHAVRFAFAGYGPRVWAMPLPIDLPVEPLRAVPADTVPDGEGWHYEPRWDGFRAIACRDGEEVRLQSRDLRPIERYFPELVAPLRQSLPARSVVDGALVIAGEGGLDFPALLARIDPEPARVALLA